MREHEVPTHVQAEDRVLLGFTFPQVVAVMAVCAISYGAYRYAPVGPSEVRMALAVVFGLFGVAMVVGKIGGRRLPLVAADLLKYRLGARVYAGPVSQLVRSEPPAPAQPVKSGPGPLSLMAKRAGRGLGRLRKNRKTRKNKERRNGRMRWFGKRRGKDAGNQQARDHRAETLETRRRKPRKGFLAFAAVAVLAAAVATVPQAALADDHEPWRDEIDFEVEEPVEGRRIFVEGLSVTGDRAAVTLRAATELDIRVRAFGGPEGTLAAFLGLGDPWPRGSASTTRSPSTAPKPSFTVSWEDTLGQAGALTFEHEQIPYPLPAVEGELCDLRRRRPWAGRPSAVSGVGRVRVRHAHRARRWSFRRWPGTRASPRRPSLDAQVTAIAGTVSAATGASHGQRRLRPQRRDQLHGFPSGTVEAIHAVSVDVTLEASLRIPMPPLTQSSPTTRSGSEQPSPRPCSLHGGRGTATPTVTRQTASPATHGTTASATDHTAYAYVPSATHRQGRTIHKDVTVTIVHPEHVKAEVVERSPITRTREESLSLESAVGSDDPFKALVLPEPEPEEPPAEQEPADGLRGWFDLHGLGVALVRRALAATLLLLTGVGPRATTGAAAPEERDSHAGRSSTACSRRWPTRAPASAVFAIVWAGLRPDGGGRRGARRGHGPRPPWSWRWSAWSWCSRPRAWPRC